MIQYLFREEVVLSSIFLTNKQVSMWKLVLYGPKDMCMEGMFTMLVPGWIKWGALLKLGTMVSLQHLGEWACMSRKGKREGRWGERRGQKDKGKKAERTKKLERENFDVSVSEVGFCIFVFIYFVQFR